MGAILPLAAIALTIKSEVRKNGLTTACQSPAQARGFPAHGDVPMKSKFLAIALIVAPLLGSPIARAANPEDVQRLRDTNECSECDLSNIDLSGMDLSNAKLGFSNLRGSNLAGTNLEEAFLFGADLRETNLQNANLRDAELESAKLSGARLEGANLGGAFLRYASLWKANLSNANLTDSVLEGAFLFEARGVNLEGATLCLTTLPDGTTSQEDCD